METVTLKSCNRCSRALPLDSFKRDKNRRDGRYPNCRECESAHRRATRSQRDRDVNRSSHRRNRDRRLSTMRAYNARPDVVERRRAASLLRSYGITADEYAALHDAQNGLCAACGNAEEVIDKRTGAPRRLAVDHDHASGAVRGLLCLKCNKALGLLGDAVDGVRALLAYIESKAT